LEATHPPRKWISRELLSLCKLLPAEYHLTSNQMLNEIFSQSQLPKQFSVILKEEKITLGKEGTTHTILLNKEIEEEQEINFKPKKEEGEESDISLKTKKQDEELEFEVAESNIIKDEYVHFSSKFTSQNLKNFKFPDNRYFEKKFSSTDIRQKFYDHELVESLLFVTYCIKFSFS
jgi:hypothetical protein